ncbi:MAG: ATP-binding protein [Chthoniobacterales bacterium]
MNPTICDPCDKKRQVDPAEESRKRRAAFRAALPSAFRDTDRTRLPDVLVQEVEDYRFGAIGLAFVGKSGAGKTRAMLTLLERLAGEGRTVQWLTATDLSFMAGDQFSDDPQERHNAKETLRRVRRVDVVFLDDVGKGRMTDRAESELFDILDTRTREGRPTLWTSNSGGRDLLAMLSADRGDALLRRLGKEFSNVVRV